MYCPSWRNSGQYNNNSSSSSNDDSRSSNNTVCFYAEAYLVVQQSLLSKLVDRFPLRPRNWNNSIMHKQSRPKEGSPLRSASTNETHSLLHMFRDESLSFIASATIWSTLGSDWTGQSLGWRRAIFFNQPFFMELTTSGYELRIVPSEMPSTSFLAVSALAVPLSEWNWPSCADPVQLPIAL